MLKRKYGFFALVLVLVVAAGGLAMAQGNNLTYLPLIRASVENPPVVLTADYQAITTSCPAPQGGAIDLQAKLIERTDTTAQVGIKLNQQELEYQPTTSKTLLLISACGTLVRWGQLLFDPSGPVTVRVLNPVVRQPTDDFMSQGVQPMAP